VLQRGNRHSATVYQNGDWNYADVKQYDSNNMAIVQQTSLGEASFWSKNQTRILQSGGSGNFASVTQLGINSSVTIQMGSNNHASVNQASGI